MKQNLKATICAVIPVVIAFLYLAFDTASSQPDNRVLLVYGTRNSEWYDSSCLDWKRKHLLATLPSYVDVLFLIDDEEKDKKKDITKNSDLYFWGNGSGFDFPRYHHNFVTGFHIDTPEKDKIQGRYRRGVSKLIFLEIANKLDYDYFWFVEDDAIIYGAWSSWMERFNSSTADIVGVHGRRCPGSWQCGERCSTCEDNKAQIILWNLIRLSKNMVNATLEALQNNYGHHEIFLSTICQRIPHCTTENIPRTHMGVVDVRIQDQIFSRDGVRKRCCEFGYWYKAGDRNETVDFQKPEVGKYYHPIKCISDSEDKHGYIGNWLGQMYGRKNIKFELGFK